MLQLFSQETYLLMKVIVKCVNIKLWDILSCFHYILNAPRTLNRILHRSTFAVQLPDSPMSIAWNWREPNMHLLIYYVLRMIFDYIYLYVVSYWLQLCYHMLFYNIGYAQVKIIKYLLIKVSKVAQS